MGPDLAAGGSGAGNIATSQEPHSDYGREPIALCISSKD